MEDSRKPFSPEATLHGTRVAAVPTICIAEDRQAEEVGVRLLIQSILASVGSPRIKLWCPRPSADFQAWLSEHPAVELSTNPLSGSGSWNVKAAALLECLRNGAEVAWWLDSDVIVTRDFIERFSGIPDETLLICEEAAYGNKDGDGIRARGWGFAVQRAYPSGLNTAAIRTSSGHIPLLETWVEKLADPAYQQAQHPRFEDRPPHLLGDQDVLTALLCGPFHTVPMRVMRRGADVIQYFGPPGFSLSERWAYVTRGAPSFIHSQGPLKPWRAAHTLGKRWTARGVFERLERDASPYLGVARRFRGALAPADWRVMNKRSMGGWSLVALGFGTIPLTGVPLAMAYFLHTTAARLRRRTRSGAATIAAQ